MQYNSECPQFKDIHKKFCSNKQFEKKEEK